jgi:hypothetical protein
MNIRRIAEMGLHIEEADEQHLQMLRQLPLHADASGNPLAEQRLFPGLIASPDTSDDFEANRDWDEMVGSELRKRFAMDMETVAGDVEKAYASGENHWDLIIRFDHVLAWFSALNQARIVMHERYQFPDSDDAEAMADFVATPHGKLLRTERFFTFLQTALIQLELDPGQ